MTGKRHPLFVDEKLWANLCKESGSIQAKTQIVKTPPARARDILNTYFSLSAAEKVAFFKKMTQG